MSDSSQTSAAEPLSLVRLIQGHWLLIVVCAGAGLLAGIVAYFVLPRVYRAEVTVATTEADMLHGSGLSQLAQLSGLAGMALPSGGASYRQEAIATLRSREIARDFIAKERIANLIDPDYPETSKTDEAAGSEDSEWLNRVTTRFQDRILDIREDRRSGMIIVAIDWQQPEIAASWANSLVKLADERLRLRRRRNADDTLALIESAINKTTVVELRQALYRMYQIELEKKMQTQVNESIFFRIIDPAVPPDIRRPISPDPRFLLLGSALFGLVCGILLAMLRSARGRRSG